MTRLTVRGTGLGLEDARELGCLLLVGAAMVALYWLLA